MRQCHNKADWKKFGYIILGTIVIYSITFLVVLPSILYDRVYSAYFTLSGYEVQPRLVKQALELNDRNLVSASEKLLQAQEKASKVDNGYDPNDDEGEMYENNLAIGIVSINRDPSGEFGPIGYLTQTVSSLFVQIIENKHNFKGIKPYICNVNNPGNEHTEPDDLSHIFPVVEKYSSSKETFDDEENLYEREKNDYMFCISEGLSRYNPKYLILLEDDAVPREDFFLVLWKLLKNIEERAHRDDGTKANQNWAFLKLYRPQKWAGHSRNIQCVTEVLSYSIFGGLLGTLLSHFLLRKLNVSYRFQCFLKLYYTAISATYCIILALTIGRPYLLELRRWSSDLYILTTPDGCCTQGVLYPSMVAKDLLMYLLKTQCHIDFAKDIAIDRFREIQGLEAYLVEPNLVRHVGLVSNLKRTANPAEFIYL